VTSHCSTKVKWAAVRFDRAMFSAILRRRPRRGTRSSWVARLGLADLGVAALAPGPTVEVGIVAAVGVSVEGGVALPPPSPPASAGGDEIRTRGEAALVAGGPLGGGRGEGAAVLLGNRGLLAEHGVPLPPAADAAAAEREARGETVAFLAAAGEVRAILAVADVLRDEAPEAIRALRELGLSVAVVSGDGPGATGAVAAALGVEGLAEATPQEKRELVAARQAAGRRVLFAGDGVNDAPALGQSEVGAAMGRGTDVTMESADVVLVRDDLRLLPDLIRLSRKTLGVIRQNVFWAFFYNAVAIPLAMAGVLHPIVAAAAMAASSLFVVGNSLRLRRALR
jgi:Cu2+-exporting ATPase